jgi:hypothetical protein
MQLRLATPLVLLAATVAGAHACGRGADAAIDSASRATVATATATATVATAPVALPVDSYFPPEEALRRFRAGIAASPTQLSGGAPSRDSLVHRFVRAVETQDTAAVNAMIVSRAEFAYLYYPSHPLRRAPYELDPQMMWYQLRTASEKGISRLFARLGRRPLRVVGYSCPDSALHHGGNRVWEGCVVTLTGDDGASRRQRLFGPIVERDGRYKFAGYGNDL